jgi:L-histidine Nalpha-methyltransferase
MTTQTPAQDRLRWIDTDLQKIDDGSDVIQGLTQIPKTLPCKYFYPTFRTSRKYYPNLAVSALETTRIAAFLASSRLEKVLYLGKPSMYRTFRSPLTPHPFSRE